MKTQIKLAINNQLIIMFFLSQNEYFKLFLNIDLLNKHCFR